jgi:Cys-tRNA(Pro)/Cys-tRNA(Cys) deacylase
MAKRVKGRDATGTPALAALALAGVPYEVHPYEHDRRSELSYGLEAAQAIGAEPARVFKTLVAAVDAQLVVAAVPVDSSLDLKALAAAVGGKRAELAEPADAERATGYVVGGISPLGQRQRLRTVVDSTAFAHATIYVSAGRRGLDVELTPTDLIELTDAATAAISRSSGG